MRITPRARIEQYAREQYAKRWAVAPPKVRNAVAVMALGEHRAFRWRGHKYTVPPLPWHAGMVLLGCTEILRDARVSAAGREQAARTIARTAHALLRSRRLRRPWRNPFRGPTASEAVELADRLLYVPEDVPSPPAKGTRTVDLMDGLQEYLRCGYPTTPDGLPVSWAHYQYGLRHAGRTAARETLRLAQTARMVWAGKDDWRDYIAELRSVGGW